ncbi:MAG: TRAP transporter small permease [Xanthobacteraceae bacterium]
MLLTIWRGFGHLAKAFTYLGGALLIFAALTVTAEVLLRKIVSPAFGPQYNFTGSDEIASYLFAVGTSLSLAYVVVARGNVRIDALYRLFGPRARAAMDILALAGMLVFSAALLERGWSVAELSYSGRIVSNTTLRVPLAIPQIGWVIGLAMFTVSLILALVVSIAALARGDLEGAAAVGSAITVQEEVSSELQGLGLSVGEARSAAKGER